MDELEKIFDLNILEQVLVKNAPEEVNLYKYLEACVDGNLLKSNDLSEQNKKIRLFCHNVKCLLSKIPIYLLSGFFNALFSKTTRGRFFDTVFKMLKEFEKSETYLKTLRVSSQSFVEKDGTKKVYAFLELDLFPIQINSQIDLITHLSISNLSVQGRTLFASSTQRAAFLVALLKMTALKKLDLSYNRLGQSDSQQGENDPAIFFKDFFLKLGKFIKTHKTLAFLDLSNNHLLDSHFQDLCCIPQEELDDEETYTPLFATNQALELIDISVNFLTLAFLRAEAKKADILYQSLTAKKVKLNCSGNYTAVTSPDSLAFTAVSNLDGSQHNWRQFFLTQPMYVESVLNNHRMITPQSWAGVTVDWNGAGHACNLVEAMTEVGELSLTRYDYRVPTASDVPQFIIDNLNADGYIQKRMAMEFSEWTITAPVEINALHQHYVRKKADNGNQKAMYALGANCFFHAKNGINAALAANERESISTGTEIPAMHLHRKMPKYRTKTAFQP